MLLGVILELGNRHLGEIDIGLLGRSSRLRLLLGGLLGSRLSGLCGLLGLGRLLCGSLLGVPEQQPWYRSRRRCKGG